MDAIEQELLRLQVESNEVGCSLEELDQDELEAELEAQAAALSAAPVCILSAILLFDFLLVLCGR